MSFMNGLKGDILRQKLIQMWISPNDIQWVDFNNVSDLNKLAEKIVPNMLKSNPNIANLIKQKKNQKKSVK